MKGQITPKMILNTYKRQIISEVSSSTKYFWAAYLLKENIIGKRIIIHVLFIYREMVDTFDFADETCFSIFNWIEGRRERWFADLYREGYEYDLILYPHYMSLEEFNELETDTRTRLEKKRLAYH